MPGEEGEIVGATSRTTVQARTGDRESRPGSGLSSGETFAGQMAVAFSGTVVGAGILAGGPYDCAAERPFWECMYFASPDVAPAIARTRAASGAGLDDVRNLAAQRVYLLSGALDGTVGPSVMDALRDYEIAFVAPENLVYMSGRPFAHTFPTDRGAAGDNPCWLTAPPYISNCGYDAAGALLAHIYGPLAPRASGAPAGALLRFDQTEFVASGLGLAASGRLYVPQSCAAGARCRLHVVFHGCTQNEATLGERFIRSTGYLPWADANGILLLFPQTVADFVDHDPQPSGAGANIEGCWDWVGYYGADFDEKSGVQPARGGEADDRSARRRTLTQRAGATLRACTGSTWPSAASSSAPSPSSSCPGGTAVGSSSPCCSESLAPWSADGSPASPGSTATA